MLNVFEISNKFEKLPISNRIHRVLQYFNGLIKSIILRKYLRGIVLFSLFQEFSSGNIFEQTVRIISLKIITTQRSGYVKRNFKETGAHLHP